MQELQKRKSRQAWKIKIKELVKLRSRTKEEIETDLIAAEEEKKILELKLAEERAVKENLVKFKNAKINDQLVDRNKAVSRLNKQPEV